MISRLSLLTGLFLTLTFTANAQQLSHPRGGAPGSWRLIGSTQASLRADHDIIYVAGPYDDFRALKFKVTDAPLEIQYMMVTYENGQKDRIDVRSLIPQGGESRVIDLIGGRRSLRSVEFWYKTAGKYKGTADTHIFGMK